MEDYEKFKLNKSNLVMILITSILVVILIVVVIFLVKALKKPTQGLPNLNITQGRVTTASTTASSATTTTTTTKVIREASPYYIVDTDSLLNDDIYTKRDLSRDEALEVANNLLAIANNVFDITDNSLFDIEVLANSVKEGEQDLITKGELRYGELYDFDKFAEKFFVKQSRNQITNYQFNGNRAIIKEDGKYYRLVNDFGDSNIVIVDTELTDKSQYNINIRVRYYHKDYKSRGYSGPDYTLTNFNATFEDRWKINAYKNPMFD